MAIALYFDVHVDRAIVGQLRLRQVETLTAQEDGSDRLSDESLLEHAQPIRPAHRHTRYPLPRNGRKLATARASILRVDLRSPHAGLDRPMRARPRNDRQSNRSARLGKRCGSPSPVINVDAMPTRLAANSRNRRPACCRLSATCRSAAEVAAVAVFISCGNCSTAPP